MLVKCIIKYFEIIFSGQFTLKAENAHPLAVYAMKSMIYSIGNSLEWKFWHVVYIYTPEVCNVEKSQTRIPTVGVHRF